MSSRLFVGLVALALLFGSVGTASAADRYGANTTNLAVPDNAGWVRSDITISGAPTGATVTAIDVHFSAIHSYSGDLNVDLNDPAITRYYDLWENEGGSADNPSRTRTGITTFNGLAVNGTWHLSAKDTSALDSGYIDEWWIRIYYTDSRPDLIGRNLGVSDSTPNGGQAITVYFNIKNQGNSIAGSSYQGIMLSTNTTISSSDTRLASEFTGPLFAGSDTDETNYGVNITDCITGRRYLGILVDETEAVSESDETNNNTAYLPLDVPPFVTVSGTIRFENRTFSRTGFTGTNIRLARDVLVEIRDTSDTVLASAITGTSTGFFSVVVPCLYNGETFKVAVLAVSSVASVGSTDSTAWVATKTFQAASTNVDVSWTLDDATYPNTRAALNLIDAIQTSATYATNIDDANRSPDDVHVITTNCPGGGGGCYFGSSETIYISENRRDVDDITFHEHGHHLMRDYQDTSPPLPCPNNDCSHFSCTEASSRELAFSEGWATYVGGAAQNKEWMAFWNSDNPGNFWFELEAGTTRDPQHPNHCSLVTDRYEGSVAAVLWDARDAGTTEPFDQISNEERVFDIIDEDFNSRSTAPTIADFRNAWGASLDPLMCTYIGTNCNLAASLVAAPATGSAPLNDVDLTASVSGSAQGTINYTFYCNRSDAGTNITSGYAAKFDGITTNPKTAFDVCDYSTPGTYVAKVIVERGALAAEDRENVVVSAPPPTCYTLILARNTSSGGGLPTASPSNSSGCAAGKYIAGASITVTASPNSGWSVGSWNGTNNNSSTSTTNSVTMAAGTHTVTVNYVQNCYTLILSRNTSSGGSLPTASPSNSNGCAAGKYTAGAAITVTASPNAGWSVGSWNGTNNNSSTSTTNSVTMAAGTHTVTVNYVQTCYTLILSRNTSSGGGLPTASPSNSSGCAAGKYTAGAAITVTASPNSGWSVGSWNGTNNNSSTSTTNSVTMAAGTHTVTVNYVQTPTCYTLILSRNTSSGGSLPTASPSNSNGCAAGKYTAGAAITVTASPNSGWSVGSWNGTNNNSSTSTTNSVTMAAGTHTVTVNYVQTCYTLILSRNTSSGGGLPTASPSNSSGCAAGKYTAGASITVTASPNAGWSVGSWGGTDNNSSTSTTNSVTMAAGTHTVTVNYVQTCYTLILSRNTSSGGGLPTASPSSSSGCAAGKYTAGAAITVTASPYAGWSVGSWGGTNNNSSTSITNSVTMAAGTHTVTVNYVQACYTLILARNTSSGGGMPTASPSNSNGCAAGKYTAGAAITVTASPYVGWSVGSWGGTDDNSSTSTENSVTMAAGTHTVTVNYVETPPSGSTLSFYTVTPCRLADTRVGPSPLYPGVVQNFAVTGVCGVPATAKAVSINATAVDGTSGGYIVIFPANQPVPPTSTITFRAGQIRSNNAMLALSSDGRLAALAAIPSGYVHLILDVNGYFADPMAGVAPE